MATDALSTQTILQGIKRYITQYDFTSIIFIAKMPPEDFGSEGHQDVVGRTVLFEHLGCRGTPEVLSKFSAPPMVIGDNHEWGVLVSTFLLDHDPSRIMDFYQIFDGPPEGVGSKWDGASDGAQLVP